MILFPTPGMRGHIYPSIRRNHHFEKLFPVLKLGKLQCLALKTSLY